MVGLPTETETDVEAIVDLAKKARNRGGQGKGRPVQINLGVATFIPKPHTPFQWEPQISLEESKRRINRLKQMLPRQGFKIKWHDPEQSLLGGRFFPRRPQVVALAGNCLEQRRPSGQLVRAF